MVFALLLLSACKKNEVEDLMSRQWVIRSITYNEKISNYGAGLFLLNIMMFEADFYCEMPMLLKERIEAYGKWEIIEKRGEFYLRVFDNDEVFYNDLYEIEIIMTYPIKEIVLKSTSKDFSMRCRGVETI